MKNRLIKSILALACCLCLLGAVAPAFGETYFGTTDYAIVTGTSYLNLRQQPSADSIWLGRANVNDWVRIHGESGNWYYVTIVESDLSGYMSKNFLTLASSAPSGGAAIGVVTNPKPTQFLNLRQYPSYDAPVLGIFYNGTTCQILSFFDGWYQVQVNGQTGYFRQEYLTINGSMTGSSSATIVTLNGGKLNLRNAPTYKGSTILAQVLNGRSVTVLQKGNLFWKVQVDGQVGYMDCQYLSERATPTYPSSPSVPVPSVTPKPTTKGYAIVNNPKSTQFLNLREQPSTSAKVLAQYKNGIRFEVIEQGETWCKVYGSATGNIGYLMTKYLKLYDLPATPTKTVQNGKTYVNFRSAPSKQTGNVYDKLYSGSVVTVLTPGDEWTQVRYGHTEGYMMSAFLK